ncbi:hypothetical protein NMD50_23945 (plasmid) [Escherichia coli]|jgi:hypothetical protein
MLNCARDTPRLLQTSLIRRSQATRAHAQSIFCPAELHGLFEYLGFHRLFAQKALEFANLLIGGSEFGGRHHFLARCNSRQ